MATDDTLIGEGTAQMRRLSVDDDSVAKASTNHSKRRSRSNASSIWFFNCCPTKIAIITTSPIECTVV